MTTISPYLSDPLPPTDPQVDALTDLGRKATETIETEKRNIWAEHNRMPHAILLSPADFPGADRLYGIPVVLTDACPAGYFHLIVERVPTMALPLPR